MGKYTGPKVKMPMNKSDGFSDSANNIRKRQKNKDKNNYWTVKVNKEHNKVKLKKLTQKSTIAVDYVPYVKFIYEYLFPLSDSSIVLRHKPFYLIFRPQDTYWFTSFKPQDTYRFTFFKLLTNCS